MPSRYREIRDVKNLHGTVILDMGWPFPIVTYDLYGMALDYKTCYDTVGHMDISNPFDLLITETHVPALDGEFLVNGKVVKTFNEVPFGYQPPPPNVLEVYPVLTGSELNNFGYEAVGSTNPSAPSFSLPTYIGELKDLPDLIRGWGGSRLYRAAKGYVSWRWAIKPMIRDIASMWNFVESVEKTLRALHKLKSDGKLCRRCSIRTQSTTIDKGWGLMHSAYASVYGHRFVDYTEQVWASVQWLLDEDFEILPSRSLAELAQVKQVMLGLELHDSFATAWELLPWSWLVDWFMPVGSFIDATRNSFPCHHGDICIMQTTTGKSRYLHNPGDIPDWLRLTGAHSESTERKMRTPHPITGAPTATLPTFNVGHWSILASLVVLRSENPRDLGINPLVDIVQ